MVRVLKESESEIKNNFEVELKALRKIELDEDYYSPGEESSLTFELDTEGLIDINKIRKYMFLFSRFFRFDVYTYAGHRKKTASSS